MLDADLTSGVESVTYTKKTGTTRSIKATVMRRSPVQGDAGREHWMTVMVANSATYGISSTEIDPGGDTITVSYRPGGTARAYMVALSTDAVEHMDSGFLVLELR